MTDDKAHYPPVDPVRAGLSGSCPRCGSGRLFSGFLTVAPRCSSCGLDNGFADAGDGPAVFVILILGFIVTGLALVVETAFSPPLFVHMIVWTPLIIAGSIWSLRFMKAMMIALQFRTNAGEGRLS